MIARARRVDGMKVLSLNLGPLLAPHRKHGRLSIRIERLPQQARFSRGSRNNDGSWSFATDELDDLGYQLPEGFEQAHTLAVRIISLVGGNTLAVIEVPVAPGGADADGDEGVVDAATQAQVQALREQLAQMQTTLATREAELAEARVSAERARSEPAQPAVPAPTIDFEAEIAAARTEMQAEFSERLAAVGAQAAAELQKHRSAWTAELESRVAAATASAQQSSEEGRETWQRKAQEAWQRELQNALTKAEAEFKSAEAERLAAAQDEWRESSTKSLADLNSKMTAQTSGHRAELEALRSQLESEAQDALAKAREQWKSEEAAQLTAKEAEWRAASERELARARSDAANKIERDRNGEVDALRMKLTIEAQNALATAEENWKAAEAERLAQAEKKWRATHDAEIAKVHSEVGAARVEAGDAAAAQKEVTALQAKVTALEVELSDARVAASSARGNSDEAEAARQQVTSLQAKVTSLEAAIGDARKATEAAKAAAVREAEASLAAAAEDWKRQEATRLNLARAQWQAESEKALSFVNSEAQSKAGGDTAALDALRAKVEALQTTIAERDAALIEAQEVIEQQTQAARQKKGRKSDDAGRTAEAEAAWRSSYGNALADATARYEAAEAALAQVRLRTKDSGRAEQELAATRQALAAREKELADLRAKVAPLDGYEGGADASQRVEAPTPPAPQFSPTFIGGVIAAACVVAALIVFLPNIESLFVSQPPPPPVQSVDPAPKEAMRLAPAPVEVKTVLLRDAKLRSDPSTSAKSVASVTRGFEVVVLESQGKWSLVRLGPAGAPQGWVMQSMLKDNVASSSATPDAN